MAGTPYPPGAQDRSFAVAAGIVEGVTASNAQASGEGRLGCIGLVIGATNGGDDYELGNDLKSDKGE